MTSLITALTANPVLTAGSAAFMCGVALFYLVMQRTRKHRLVHAGQNET